MTRGTIVYVHGASDRAASVAYHVAQIESQLELAGMAFDVLASSWGEAAGADLSRIELALPQHSRVQTTQRVLPRVDPAPALAALAAMAQPEAPAVAAGTAIATPRRQSDDLLEICQTQIGAAAESFTLADGGSMPLATACRDAASGVATSSEYTHARASAASEPALVDAVGRAVVSAVAAPAAAPIAVAQLAEVRIAEAVLSVAIAALLVGYLGIDIGPDLKRWATDVLLPHRARLIKEAGLGPADIVLYQRSGAKIREHVARTLEEAIGRGGQVIALGNSLGGIVLVDLLAEEGAPRPDLLVTVGSQAPLLATFGALAPLGGPSWRSPFQPWLNVYDRRDLLGFVAAPVWPPASGITDHEVDLGVGFPDSHGASYLSSPDVFRAIRQHPALDPSSGTGGTNRLTIETKSISRAGQFVLGVERRISYVEIDGRLEVRLGRIAAGTPADNVAGWEPIAAQRGGTLFGILGALAAGTLAVGSRDRGVRVAVKQPLRVGPFSIRALEIAADPAVLGSALEKRGIGRLTSC